MSTEDLILRIKQEYDGKGLKELKSALSSVQGDIDKFRGTNVNAFNESIQRAGVLTQEINKVKNEYSGLQKYTGQSITFGSQQHLSSLTSYRNTLSATSPEFAKITKEINAVNSSLASNKGQVTQSTSAWSQFGANFTVMAAGVGIALSKIKQYLGDIADAYFKAEVSSQKLSFATDGNSDSLMQYAKTIQQTTIYSHVNTEEAMSFLATQGRTEEQIKKTIRVAADMSAVLGGDLNENMRKLDMTYEGSLGRLGRLDGSLKNLSAEELKNGKAVDIIGEKYKGMAEIVGNTTYGQVEKLKNSLNEIKESFGEGFFRGLSRDILDTTDKSKNLDSELEKNKKTATTVGDVLATVFKYSGIGMAIDEIGKAVSGLSDDFNGLLYVMGLVNAQKAGLVYQKQDKGLIDKLFPKESKLYDFYGKVIQLPHLAEEAKPAEEKTGRGGKSGVEKQIEYTDELIEKQKELIKLQTDYDAARSAHPELDEKSRLFTENLDKQKEILSRIHELTTAINLPKLNLTEIPYEDKLRTGYAQTGDPFNTRNKYQLDYEAKKYNEIADKGLSLAEKIGSILNLGANTFVMRLINGLQEGLSLARQISEFLQMIHAGSSFLSFLVPGVPGAGGSAMGMPGGMHSGLNGIVGDMMSRLIVSNTMQNNFAPNITVTVTSEVEKAKAVKFLYKNLPLEKKYRMSKS